MLTGCLAPLAPMVFQTASTLILTFNIFIVSIFYFEQERVKIKKIVVVVVEMENN